MPRSRLFFVNPGDMSHIDGPHHNSSLGLKRKANDPTLSFTRQAPHKVIKAHSADSPHRTHINGNSATDSTKAAYKFESEPEDDVEAGPSLPPEDEEEEEDELGDDEGGRFFGGGVSKQERDVLKYVEENEDDAADENIDLVWLKKTALSFERKINKNAELRAKYADEPLKFVASEADLDTEIKNLTLMSEHSKLYPDFVRSGCVDSLVGLLAHDNTDIAISVCEVIEELIDEDSDVQEKDWEVLVKAMLDADLIELLVSNLYRLDQTNEADRNGIHHILSIFEALLSDTATAGKLGQSSKLLAWLVDRTRKEEEVTKIGQNRQYAAELLVILSQNSDQTASRLIKLDYIDTLLQLLSMWRFEEPEKDSIGEEFAENLFDCLISLVKLGSGVEKFVKDEGVELCVFMIKEGKFARRGALRVLDHAAGSANGSMVCEQIVEAGGLKVLFTTFMKSRKVDREQIEHLLGIFSGMLRQLPGNSATRIRTLAKFIEKDYEKCDRLLELHQEYTDKATAIDRQIRTERSRLREDEAVMMEPEWLSRRLDAGLFILQTLDVILAWLIAEDGGARLRIESGLKTAGNGLDTIKRGLQEQLDGIEVDDDSNGVSTRDMLQTLIECL